MLGNIYHDSFDEESVPPKPKYYIVVGLCDEGDEFATIFINSNINEFFIDSDELYDMQYPLSPTGNFAFLDHNSFADCANLQYRCTIPFNRKIANGVVNHVGSVPADILGEFSQIIQNSGLIPSYYLNKFNI